METLISDVRGSADALAVLLDERPDVLNHNVETVARLQRAVRPSAGYARSLSVLARAKEARLTTKSGFMVGLGETSSPRLASSSSTACRSSTSSAKCWKESGADPGLRWSCCAPIWNHRPGKPKSGRSTSSNPSVSP